MQAKDLMSREVRSVRSSERLDAAAHVMWEHDCGFCPVVDAAGVLVGVVTDRDLCMAAYTKGRTLAEVPVAAVMARPVRTCRGEDGLGTVLQALQEAQVHRLPVVDARGQLLGVLGTNDLVRAAAARPTAVDAAAVLKTLATIGAPRRAVPPLHVEVVAAPAPAVAVAVAEVPTQTAAPATPPVTRAVTRPVKAAKTKKRT